MLKKIIIGVLGFIFLVVIGLGIYIYMLDWNQHKKLVEERFSQITGLRAVINGDLNVELFPSPKFTANQVTFFPTNGGRDPLVKVNSISANVDFMAMMHQNFILSSMNLAGATVHYTVNGQGVSNWKGVGASTNNHSGNIEVSFKDVRFTNSTFNYNNLQKDKHFEIPNISGFVSAPSLKGPYQLNLQFIHNENEIKIGGNIVKNNDLSLDLAMENATTSSKIALNGSLGSTNRGNISIDTARFTDFVAVVFGPDTLPKHYNDSFYLSFQYEGNGNAVRLNNFNIAYGNATKGNGTVVINHVDDKYNIESTFDMSSIDLTLLEIIGTDIVSHINKNQTSLASLLSGYNFVLNAKSGRGIYRNAEIQNLNLVAALENNVLSLTRFDVDCLGTTSLKTVGKIDFNDILDYTFDNDFKTGDLRTFVSLFDIDLAKLADDENKKLIFKKAESSFNITGNLKNLKLKIPHAVIDAVELRGNMGFIFDNDKTYVIADLSSSQILFNKYLNAVPENMHNLSLEKKLVYQFNLIPWKHNLSIDAHILIPSAVYNKVPLQNLVLEAKLADDNLLVKKLSIENIAGASLNMQADAQKIYTAPYFNELSYDVKTNNFPSFATNLGIATGAQKLFHRKLFAAQGALNGSFNNLNISSIQKFGDVEFAYTGTVVKSEGLASIDGNLELKSNNFTDLVHALNLDYTPDIPVTTFTLAGKIKGTNRNFSLSDFSAYLGANNIRGSLLFDRNGEVPDLTAKLYFDKFDADRYMNLSKLHLITHNSDQTHTFVAKPDILADKIDYSLLKNVNYTISSTAQQLVYNNKTYSSALLDTSLKNGILNVLKFNAKNGDNKIKLAFTLNSNNIPEIEGDYDIQSFQMPVIGGTTYEIQNGILNSKGHFKSIIPSVKDFVENLNAKGNFHIADTTIKGWDLDLIKFELEQRKTTDGLENNILNNLKSGLSSLSQIEGDFTVSKGLLVSDNTLIDAPVADLSMKLDFNLGNWLFTANFDTIYRNATFSDVFRYTFNGNLADPKVEVDLSESLKRIGDTETMIQKAKEAQEKELQQKLSDKIDMLRRQVDAEIKNASQLDLYTSKYKPQTDHADVLKAYNINLQNIEEIKKSLSEMAVLLKDKPVEKDLMDIESQLSSIKSKLAFIPKSLEDNYMVDSKYIFDDLFDKIAWVYNVATNNSAYYTGLADIYWAQIDLIRNSENPIDDDVFEELKANQEVIHGDIEKISTLHDKMRENYVNIIETSNATDMKEKNELTRQALQTLLVYTVRMNENILRNLDKFRETLNLTADDDAQYIIYPPQNVDDIDTNAPTTMLLSVEEGEKVEKTSKAPSTNDVDKKKEQTTSLNLPLLSDGLSLLIQKFQLSHVNSITLAENVIKPQIDSKMKNDAVNKYADKQSEDTLSDAIVVETSPLPNKPSDAALTQQAKETVLAILTGSSFASSLNETSTVSSSLATFSSSETPVVSALMKEPSFSENEIFNPSDLNLKSGFKKASKHIVEASKPVHNLAILDIISFGPADSVAPHNDTFNTKNTYSAHNEKITSSVSENSSNLKQAKLSFSGNIGKSMLLHYHEDTYSIVAPKTQYLFAYNGKFSPFSGTVAKNIFLGVK